LVKASAVNFTSRFGLGNFGSQLMYGFKAKTSNSALFGSYSIVSVILTILTRPLAPSSLASFHPTISDSVVTDVMDTVSKHTQQNTLPIA